MVLFDAFMKRTTDNIYMKKLIPTSILLLVSLFLSSFTIENNDDTHSNLNVKVLTEKPAVCNYKGLLLKKGLVKGAVPNTQVEVMVFLQQYNGHWMKKLYKRSGSGIINMNMGDCSFTGNYHALAYYPSKADGNSISYKKIQHLHNSRGETPKFRVLERKKEEDGTVKFNKGEVFTPNGETVDVTLFLEKTDGGWRKKHYTVFGSGVIDLDISGKDITGKYRAVVNEKI